MDLYTIVAALIGACVAFLIFDFSREVIRNRRERAAEFDPAWLGFLRRNVPAYNRLPPELKKQLQERVAIFIDEIDFEACGGLENVTDEMRVTVAAFACLLTLEKEYPYYARLRSVLLYPDDYWATDEESDFEEEVRSGESWSTGSVVLSWDAVRRAVVDPTPGTNVAIHEFAHQIDQANGVADGLPPMDRSGSIRAWGRVMSAYFSDLQERIADGRETDIDEYAAENPAEFFAVLTEMFFEAPGQLLRSRPEVYNQLKLFYRVDPIRWAPASARRPQPITSYGV